MNAKPKCALVSWSDISPSGQSSTNYWSTVVLWRIWHSAAHLLRHWPRLTSTTPYDTTCLSGLDVCFTTIFSSLLNLLSNNRFPFTFDLWSQVNTIIQCAPVTILVQAGKFSAVVVPAHFSISADNYLFSKTRHLLPVADMNTLWRGEGEWITQAQEFVSQALTVHCFDYQLLSSLPVYDHFSILRNILVMFRSFLRKVRCPKCESA